MSEPKKIPDVKDLSSKQKKWLFLGMVGAGMIALFNLFPSDPAPVQSEQPVLMDTTTGQPWKMTPEIQQRLMAHRCRYDLRSEEDIRRGVPHECASDEAPPFIPQAIYPSDGDAP